MNIPQHSIILASAGTGKTFALSGHYLKLLLVGCAPERILATTFTRKAAGEILARVLSRLADATRSDEARESLRQQLDLPTLTRSHCLETLHTLARHIDRVHISTLDAFFGRVASAFRFDSGSSTATIASPELEARLKASALHSALASFEPKQLVALVEMLCGGRWRAQILEPLAQRVRELHTIFLSSSSAHWHALAPRGEALSPDALIAARALLNTLRLPLTKAGTPFALWLDARSHALETTATDRWSDFLAKGLAKAVIEDSPSYARQPLTEQHLLVLLPLIGHARFVLLRQRAQETHATYELLERFDSHYAAAKRSHGVATFDDIPRALLAADACGDLEHLYYRLDGQIDHLLVDEFQDTSAVQFTLLERLIDEIVQDSEARRSFFCVGDVKQSLFQWRNADPDLLATLPQRLPSARRLHLDLNRRSSNSVIDTVNRVFGHLATNTALARTPEGVAAGTRWQSEFRTHTGLARSNGFVRLYVGPARETAAAAKHASLLAAADRIAALTALNPSVSIGVLFPRRKLIPPMIAALHALGIPSSQEGGNPLTDSPAVNIALSALRIADHPGDSAAHAHVSHSALGPHLSLMFPQSHAAISAAASRIRRSLTLDGYAVTLGSWFDAIADVCDQSESARFNQLVGLAREFDSSPSLRPGDFEQLARTRHVESYSSARVRIMTIHASKGLEFDRVFLPDLSDPLISGTRDLFTVERDPKTKGITAVSRCDPLARALEPRLDAMAIAATTQRVHEQLCVLYVALTRAAYGLEMTITPPPTVGRPSGSASLGAFLAAALAPGVSLTPSTTLFSLGDDSPINGSLPHATSPQRPRPAITLRPALTGTALALPRRSPSSLVDPTPASLLIRSESSAATRGRVLHAWLEAIEWLDPYQPPAESALRAVAATIVAPCSELSRWIIEFRAMLARPRLASLLSRTAAEARLDSRNLGVRRELRFTVRDQLPLPRGPILLDGQFDRLVLARNHGVLQRAEIIDFKTSAFPTSEDNSSDPQSKQYFEQLSAYRRAAARLLRLPEPAVRAALFSLATDELLYID